MRTGMLPHTQASATASGGYKAPTTRDIPPVTLTNVPHVPPENFRDYLAKIGPLFESFQRGRAEPDQPAWMKKDKELEKTDRFAEALERRISRDASAPPTFSRQSSVSLLSPIDSPTRRRGSGQVRRNRNEPTPLSTIPTVYFDEDFHLENPRTFDVVSERAEIIRPPPGTPAVEQKAPNGTTLPPRKALATNAILQEKMSWYMDTVEVHLINSISTASSGFFAALGSLKELQTEAEESVAKIQSLREDLRRLDKEVALSGLEVAAKRRRRENVRKLGKATAQVQRVVENVRKADGLVDAGSYDEAADQMDRVGNLVCGQAEKGEEDQELIDLRPLKALQGLDTGLQELQLRIGTGFAQRFTSILMEDIRQHVEKVPSSDTLKRMSRQRGIQPVYMETNEQFRKELLVALKGLARAGHTAPATAGYREAVNKEMKAIIRRYLPSSSDDDADSMVSTSTRGGNQLTQQEKSSILARNLRALDPEDAEKLFINIYTSVSEALRRVSTQTKILLDVTSSMQAPEPKSPIRVSTRSVDEQMSNGLPVPPPKVTVQEELSQALDMSSLLGVAVDTAQTQITRVLKVRNEQSIRVSKELFLRYFTLNRVFADECEAVSGRGGNVLKGIINAQISGFVQVLGTSETERIASVLDNDIWNAEDFADHHDTLLQRVLTSMTHDPAEWNTSTTPLWQDIPASTNGTVSIPPATNGNKTTAKPAHINSTRFILVRSALSLLSPLDTLLSLTSSLPSLTPAIANSLLDLLRTFNSRACQLILGAGATRSAGLKNITTKHLALASQALSFVIELIPYIREAIRRHLPAAGSQSPAVGAAAPSPNNVLQEFDKLKRLYQDHQSGIQDKLVEIMTSRSNAHVKAMSAINFDAPPTTGTAGEPSPYVETLTKETLTLHRVLSRHLPDVEVGMIMRRIFEGYREQWVAAYSKVVVNTRQGAERLRGDGKVFGERLGKVEGFESLVGRAVEGVLEGKAKAVEEKIKVADEKVKAEEKVKVKAPEVKKVEEKGEVMFDADGADSEEEKAVEKATEKGAEVKEKGEKK
ncbi:unnamed protein product [Zymoseptoria tritici ST99CH_1A5]|uniref:Vacuolar protein sorting-associated protein 54 n=2 Tax=Zymoseptoria tritici TaxID=1047171 RepID=A0A1X7S1U3_ZYMT9|nr:unnamed protein product [Zymoseptoria tritici ST99CH_3D7]SMY27249.1 unnamed protein product [Zymoseptoria tritici ST99CH_1A5]